MYSDGLSNLKYGKPNVTLFPLYINISVDIQYLDWNDSWTECPEKKDPQEMVDKLQELPPPARAGGEAGAEEKAKDAIDKDDDKPVDQAPEDEGKNKWEDKAKDK